MPDLDISNWNTIGILTGVFTAIAGCVLWIATRIFRFGELSNRLRRVESDITVVSGEIKEVSEGLARHIDRVEDKLDMRIDRVENRISELSDRIDAFMLALSEKGVSRAYSPRQLNDEGQRILRQSGIGKIVDEEFDDLVTKVGAHEPENAYQVEQLLIRAVRDLSDEDHALKNKIEEGAYQSGSDLNTVSYVGAIYIRDRVLDKLTMTPKDLTDDDDDGNVPEITTKKPL